MKRGTLACTAIVVCLPGYFVWQMQHLTAPEDNDAMESWQPTAEAIRSTLQAEYRTKLTADNLEAKQAFGLAFQQRYRTHATQLAVCLKFREDGAIRLMLPSRLEPWYMDKIAFAAYRETRELFHITKPITLFETFAGAAPVPIGQVSPDPADSNLVRVAFDYSQSPNRARKPNQP